MSVLNEYISGNQKPTPSSFLLMVIRSIVVFYTFGTIRRFQFWTRERQEMLVIARGGKRSPSMFFKKWYISYTVSSFISSKTKKKRFWHAAKALCLHFFDIVSWLWSVRSYCVDSAQALKLVTEAIHSFRLQFKQNHYSFGCDYF